MFNKIPKNPPTVNVIVMHQILVGAHFQGKNTGNNWLLEEKYYHINVLKNVICMFFFTMFCQGFLKCNNKNTHR